LEVAAQELAGVFRVSLLRRRGEAHEVDEKDRNEAALGDRSRCGELAPIPRDGRGFRGCGSRERNLPRGGEGAPALAAELRPCRIDGAAYRASGGQPSSAFDAELAAVLVRGAAHRTGQHGARPRKGLSTFIGTRSIRPRATPRARGNGFDLPGSGSSARAVPHASPRPRPEPVAGAATRPGLRGAPQNPQGGCPAGRGSSQTARPTTSP